MSNKEEYQKAASKAIKLLGEAECILSNALLDSDVEDSIEYEYFIEGIKFQGAIRAALESNSSQEVIDPEEGSVSYSPLSFDHELNGVDLNLIYGKTYSPKEDENQVIMGEILVQTLQEFVDKEIERNPEFKLHSFEEFKEWIRNSHS